MLIRIINGSTSYQAAALALRQDVPKKATMRVMARRLKVPVDDRAVTLITDVWAVIFSESFAGLGQPGQPEIELEIVSRRLAATVALFRSTWTPWGNAFSAGPSAGRPSTANPPRARETDSDYLPLVTDSFVPVANRRRG